VGEVGDLATVLGEGAFVGEVEGAVVGDAGGEWGGVGPGVGVGGDLPGEEFLLGGELEEEVEVWVGNFRMVEDSEGEGGAGGEGGGGHGGFRTRDLRAGSPRYFFIAGLEACTTMGNALRIRHPMIPSCAPAILWRDK
jgi:hypothetical protein